VVAARVAKRNTAHAWQRTTGGAARQRNAYITETGVASWMHSGVDLDSMLVLPILRSGLMNEIAAPIVVHAAGCSFTTNANCATVVNASM